MGYYCLAFALLLNNGHKGPSFTRHGFCYPKSDWELMLKIIHHYLPNEKKTLIYLKKDGMLWKTISHDEWNPFIWMLIHDSLINLSSFIINS